MIANTYSDVRITNSEMIVKEGSGGSHRCQGNGGSGDFPNLELANVNISGFLTGIYHSTSSGRILVTDCIIENNSGPGDQGRGIYVNGSTSLQLSHTTVRNNQSNTLGGGIYIGSAPSATIQNCIISNNTANNYGGGLLTTESNVTIEDTEICGNFPDQTAGQWGDLGGNIVTSFCPCPDCNDNGISDCEDIGTGSSSDLNGNNIPDECDLIATTMDSQISLK